MIDHNGQRGKQIVCVQSVETPFAHEQIPRVVDNKSIQKDAGDDDDHDHQDSR